jgi:hypothetical protein
MIESVLAFFAAFFILGSASFWVGAVGLFILILAFEENDWHFWAGLTLLAFVFLMEKSGAISIFTSPLIVLKWGAVYMAAGAGWSFIKWFSYLHKQGDRIGALKLKWIEGQNREIKRHNESGEQQELLDVNVSTPVPDQYKRAYKEFLSSEGFIRSASSPVTPQIGDNKARITSWIVWWPWSALWTILNDPIRRIAEFIYNRLQSTYQAVANRVFAKFAVDED